MAFRFKPAETFDDGFRRIAFEQIERAQTRLRGDGDDATAVHETRKSLKRLRAMLRLVRPALGEKSFKSENAFLRDIGVSLSGARDRFVMLQTLHKVAADVRPETPGLIDDLSRRIGRHGNAGEADPIDVKAAKARAYDWLEEAKSRLGALDFAGDSFDVVGAGLEQSYRRARNAFADAYRSGHDEAFHDWRKGAQTHWRQMLLLAPAWPEYLGARAVEARALSQLLGDDHDLAVLVGFLESDAAEGIGEGCMTIAAAAKEAQQVLRAEAHARGRRLFAVGPKRLRRGVGKFWEAAKALQVLESGHSAEPVAASKRPQKRVVAKVSRKVSKAAK